MSNSPQKQSESSQMESFSGSWIELENKTNNEKTNETEEEVTTETSPTTSNQGDQDEAAMTQALADAQDELSRSVLNQTSMTNDEAEEILPKKRESRKSMMSLRGTYFINCGYDFVQHPAFYVSTMLASHTLAVAVGIFIGKRMASQSRL